MTATDPSSSRAPEREVFLDAIRVIALLRVVLWHALGAAALTYVIAAVPTMFFVTGSLLAKSLRRGAGKVIVDRARRILVPLWVFAAGAYAAMLVAHALDGTPATAVPWPRLVLWLLPLDDPVGSSWEGGYMSAPLWYLRTLLWLLVLSPALLWLVKRTRGTVILLPLVAVFVLEALARNGTFAGPWAWKVGDLVLYSIFLMLGFVHRLGGLDRFGRAHWAAIGAVATAGAVLWCTSQAVPDGVVNDSHPAHLYVGFAWLALFFIARPLIESMAATRAGRASIKAVSHRTITVYLWHSTAIVVSFHVLRGLDITFPPGSWTIALLGLTAMVTMVFVFVFGWVEDLASKRAARAWPSIRPARPRPHAGRHIAGAFAATGTLVIALAASGLTPSGTSAGAEAVQEAPQLRVPSRAPTAPVFQSVSNVEPTPEPEPTSPMTAAQRDADLERAARTWMDEEDVPGIQVAVYRPGTVDWRFGSGVDPVTGAIARDDDRVDIGSITKTFTAALVWQAVDRGLIDLDAPIGRLSEVPDFTHGELTPRQLLRHSTGLVNYRDTPEYQAHPSSIDTPEAALAASSRLPLTFPPGWSTDYSSSNYLVLGFLLEAVTDESYDTLVADLIAEAGLGEIPHLEPAAGMPNFSTAGLTPTTSQLARWGVALFGDNTPQLSEAARSVLVDIDPQSGLGAGAIGYCPCTIDADGAERWTAYGHSGGYTMLVFDPGSRVSVVVNVTDSLYVSIFREWSTLELIAELRRIASRQVS